jgi:hypothetical protein
MSLVVMLVLGRYQPFPAMTLDRKLKIFVVVTFIGVVLMTASFVSPWWVILSAHRSIFRDTTFTEYLRGVHFSSGLWYFTVCFHYSEIHHTKALLFDKEHEWHIGDRGDSKIVEFEKEQCHVISYFCDSEVPFMDAYLGSKYKEIKGNFVLKGTCIIQNVCLILMLYLPFLWP